MSINSATVGTLNITAGTIIGNLTVNVKNATVNNSATINGTINIIDVSVGTWNENADNNKIVVNDTTGITLNIRSGRTVGSLTLNQPTTLTIGEGANLSNPILVNANSIIITKEPVEAIINDNVQVTIKKEEADEGTVIVGKGLDQKVNLDLIATITEAEKAIKDLPSLKDIRISHKDAVLKAKALVEKVKALDPTAKVQAEEIIAQLLEKIAYLEKETDSDILYTQVTPYPGTGYFKESKVTFEGYFYNVKYIEKVLIGNEEANIEYISNWEFKDTTGKVLYTGPAYKYHKEIDYASGYYEEKVMAISESGRKQNTTARFFVDTIAPELDIVVKGINEHNEIASDEVEVEVTMKDNFYDLRLVVWDSEEFSQEATQPSQFNKSVNVTKNITVYYLDMGVNAIPFVLTDRLGNETIKIITITRIQ